MTNVVIVGAGLMGRWHMRAALGNGGRIVGIFDCNGEAAERLASTVRGGNRPAAGDDLSAILEQANSDVVHVCTPLDSHFDLCGRMLEAGQHVLIEKPLAHSEAETQTLLTHAGGSGLLIRPVHQLAFQRWLPKLESIGECLDLAYDVCSAGAVGMDARGSDAVVDEILSHPLSLFDRIKPGALAAAQFDVIRPRPGQLHAHVAAGDVGLSISISMDGRPTRHELRVSGTKGTLVADLLHGFAWIETGDVGRIYKIARPFIASARWGSAATTNLARRILWREPAYPGLKELVASFYAEIRTGVVSDAGNVRSAGMLQIAHVRDQMISVSRRG